jgi:hypothetical protein
MSQTINNIALYFDARKGDFVDYFIILSIYNCDDSTGLPYGQPIASSVRGVSDIDHKGWYVFNFSNPVVLQAGSYCMIAYHSYENIEDKDINFIEWVHSRDIETNQDVMFVSSEYFEDSYSYGYTNVYNYGYGYDEALSYLKFLMSTGLFLSSKARSLISGMIISCWRQATI